MSEIEYVLTILSGLSEEYKASVISSKETLPSMQHVHSTLPAREGRIDQKNHKILNYQLTMQKISKEKIKTTTSMINLIKEEVNLLESKVEEGTTTIIDQDVRYVRK